MKKDFLKLKIQTPDPELDPDLDPHLDPRWPKMLDPDPHETSGDPQYRYCFIRGSHPGIGGFLFCS